MSAEKKEKWQRTRIRASSHDMLIRQYQDLRQRLIEDGGTMPVWFPTADDNERITLPVPLMQE